MGRAPCCDKANVKKGPWSPEEDTKLKEFIDKYGTGGNWIALPHKAGLKRCGKSCRLRWLNYLRPNIKHGEFSHDEDRIICTLFATIGSRWSIIAAQLPGRTDNDIKNYWNTKLKKKLLGIPPNINSQRCKKSTTNQNQHQQVLLSSSPSPAATTPPKPLLISGLDCSLLPSTNIPQDHIFNSTSTTTLFQGPAASSLSSQYQISFGGPEQSSSSSESYEQQQQQQQQMGFESYLYGAGFGHWGSSDQGPLEYGYEEVKNLINASSNYNNSTTSTTTSATVFVDDPPAAAASIGARVGEGGGLYHFW